MTEKSKKRVSDRNENVEESVSTPTKADTQIYEKTKTIADMQRIDFLTMLEELEFR